MEAAERSNDGEILSSFEYIRLVDDLSDAAGLLPFTDGDCRFNVEVRPFGDGERRLADDLFLSVLLSRLGVSDRFFT